jgi:hypothetical protein
MGQSESAPETQAEILYLCSSNIRPLYLQDILDLLGAPTGAEYMFRYEESYVSGNVRARWSENRLAGVQALILFSLQQEARYHDPVLFPVRRGTVVRSSREGKALFIEFRLDGLLSLPQWEMVTDGGRDRPAYEEPPKRFTAHLRAKVPFETYPASLATDHVSGSDLVDEVSEAEVLFERTTEYLTRVESFRRAWFFRCLRLLPRGADPDAAVAFDSTAGAFVIDGGRSYELQISQRQPRDVREPQRFSVSSDQESLRVVGEGQFSIGSRYDRVSILLDAVEPAAGHVREAVVTVVPVNEGIQSPRLRVPFRIRPSVGEAAVGVVNVLGLVGVALLAQFDSAGASWTILTILLILASQLVVRLPAFVGWTRRLLGR